MPVRMSLKAEDVAKAFQKSYEADADDDEADAVDYHLTDAHKTYAVGNGKKESIQHKINPKDSRIYLLDVPMAQLLPALNKMYRQSFLLKETLPQGDFCILSFVSSQLPTHPHSKQHPVPSSHPHSLKQPRRSPKRISAMLVPTSTSQATVASQLST